MKNILFVVLCLLVGAAGSVQAQSTTSARNQAPSMSTPPAAPGAKEAFTLKKFRGEKGGKKFKKEKPLKTKNKYNPKKAARRVKRY